METASSTTLVSTLDTSIITQTLFAEFLAATIDAQTFMREDYLRTAFQMFDSDKSGKIDANELKQLLEGEEFKDVYTKEQLEQAIAEVDDNGDGEIDFEEFMTMMKQIA